MTHFSTITSSDMKDQTSPVDGIANVMIDLAEVVGSSDLITINSHIPPFSWHHLDSPPIIGRMKLDCIAFEMEYTDIDYRIMAN